MKKIDGERRQRSGTSAIRSTSKSKVEALAKEVEKLMSRFPVLEEELEDLADLNLSMFRNIVDSNAVSNEIFSAEFDRTDPKADRCKAPRDWNLRIQGDFYVSWRFNDSIYFVVGDPVGHHSYAGGIKLFMATALKEIFDRRGCEVSRPEATDIVTQLDKSFSKLAEFASKESQQSIRANVVVLRIDCRPDRRITYASAGLPVHSLCERGLTACGEYRDTKGVHVSRAGARGFEAAGCIEDVPFLVVMTDGFWALRRAPLKSKRPLDELEIFGDRIEQTLLRALRPRTIGKTKRARAAQHLAEALVAEARDFRRDHQIPECFDDDRLVVVIDLEEIWCQGAKGAFDRSGAPSEQA